jgi:hypothetical protein
MNPLRTLMYTNRPLATIGLVLASAITPALAVPLALPAPTTPPTVAYSRDLTATGLTQATLEAEGWTVDRATARNCELSTRICERQPAKIQSN